MARTLFQKLKPEFIEKINAKQDKFPTIIAEIFDTLRSKTAPGYLTLNEATDLFILIDGNFNFNTLYSIFEDK
jgi:hypothetical protein